jgi:hypothetical protein
MIDHVSFDPVILVARVAATDCEAMRNGLARQPVNAISSLAIVAVGGWILVRASRRKPGTRGELAAFGMGMAMVGVGSLLLHGPAPAWALWFHDLAGLAVLLLVAALNLALLLGWTFRKRLLVVAAGLVLLGVELAALPTSTVSIAWVLAPAAGLSQLAVVRARHRWSSHPVSPASIRAWAIAGVVLAGGGAAYLLGRSGSPLCHPEGVLQFHAVWHVLVAISAALFAYTAFERDPREDVATSTVPS